MRRSLRSRPASSCALMALLAASVATAQVTGLYYQEVEKDGRIYVFNTPEKYQLWEQTGDMGIAITLIGRGPNGETVVAENETAADLYFFKHNLPGYDRPTPKPAAPAFTVGWKDGKTTISRSARAGHLQPHAGPLHRREPRGRAGERPDRSSFPIRRMQHQVRRLGLHQGPHLRAAVRTAPTPPTCSQDANVNYDFTKGKKLFMLKAGQYKVPFGRQQLTSSGNQQFVDRSVVSDTFARGRDIGVQLWGTPTTASSTGASASSTATAAR